MPRERQPFNRKKKHKQPEKVFVLAYEGNLTEPQYYEALRERLRFKNFVVQVQSLKRAANDTKSAPKYVFQQLKEAKSKLNFRATDEFWMIIDKDEWKLDEWMKKCAAEKNFYLAISNPCFEFWLWLHCFKLADYSAIQQEELFRNKKISRKRRFVDNYLSEHLPQGYKKNDILPERFLDHIEQAIAQAKTLDKGAILEHLGSDNYKLVEKLLHY